MEVKKTKALVNITSEQKKMLQKMKEYDSYCSLTINSYNTSQYLLLLLERIDFRSRDKNLFLSKSMENGITPMLLSNKVNKRLNEIKVQEGLSKSLVVRLTIEYSYSIYRKYMDIIEKKNIDEVSDKQVIIGTCGSGKTRLYIEPFYKQNENVLLLSSKNINIDSSDINTFIHTSNMFEPFSKEEIIKIENIITDSDRNYKHLLIDEANNILRTDDLKDMLALAIERSMSIIIVMPTIEYLLEAHPEIYNDKEYLVKYIDKAGIVDPVPPCKIAYLIERTRL